VSKKPNLYLLQNLSAGYVGNSPLFWAKGDSGYTQWLDDAKQFTFAECRDIIRSTSGSHKWKPWKLSTIEKHSRRSVDIQHLRAHGKK
jgi:hypothetical protein